MVSNHQIRARVRDRARDDSNTFHEHDHDLSRIRVIDSCEFGDLEMHHVVRGLAHELLLTFAVGMFGDHFGGHGGVLLVGDSVDGEELDLLIIKTVVQRNTLICSSE